MTDFKSIFGVNVFKETFNRKAALYLSKNMHLYEKNPTKQADATNAMGCLLQQSRGESFINVGYAKAKAAKGFKSHGRWYAKAPVHMQGMKRECRQTICAGLWIDIDIVNCHPKLLQSLYKKLYGECPKFLSRYNDDREAMLHEMMQSVGEGDAPMARSDAKKNILQAMYGGVVEDVKVTWWDEMNKEFEHILRKVAEHATSEVYAKDIPKDTYNRDAKITSAALQQAENHCLELLFNILKGEEMVSGECSLIFDGLMIRDNSTNRDKLTDAFLKGVSKKIYAKTKHWLDISVKEFDEAYELPENYEDHIQDIFTIDAGNDAQAVEEFFKRFPGKLIKSQGRVFWEQDGIYTEDAAQVKDGIVGAIRSMEIFMKSLSKSGELVPYSRNRKHIDDCLKLIMHDNTSQDPTFVEKLFSSTLRYLAFEDVVYSFETGQTMPYSEAKGIYFTTKIHRPFPTNVNPATIAEVFEKILIPIFPDKAQMNYYLHRMSRSMAGEVFDKLWHVCIGERNSGKGVLCDMLKHAFQCFIHTINSESLLVTNNPNADAAKGQSWMSQLEFKRVGQANEVKLQGGKAKIDGNIVKRLASGGDEVQTRTNHKDETNKHLQCTIWLNCNEMAPVEPVDAHQTLEVFHFTSAFVSKQEMESKGKSCPKHWKEADAVIKTWINTPEVIDAFTMIILGAYSTKAEVPPVVSGHSDLFKGESAVHVLDRVAEVVKYDTSGPNMFTDEVKLKLEDAGITGLTSFTIATYIDKLYGHMTPPPVNKQIKKDGKRGYGFTNIQLEDVFAFNLSDQRKHAQLRTSEISKHQIRNEVTELGKRQANEMSN
jgi:hypothetical protein